MTLRNSITYIWYACVAVALLASCDKSTSSDDETVDNPSSSSVLSSSSAEELSSSSQELSSSSSSESPDTLFAEIHEPVVYQFERDPKIVREGFGMDIFHSDHSNDTAYLTASKAFDADLIFYNVMVYYKGTTGDSVSEGCPGIYLFQSGLGSALGVQVGKGYAFFEAYTKISPEDVAALRTDPVLDFEVLKYGDKSIQRDTLFRAYASLVIGNDFRSQVLTIPEGSSEIEEQPVYLLRTHEGGYAKFMVKQFMGTTAADKKLMTVVWQKLVSPK